MAIQAGKSITSCPQLGVYSGTPGWVPLLTCGTQPNSQPNRGYQNRPLNLPPTNWIREDVIFFSQHGPFPAYLKRFHLSDSDYCSCGGIGTALHYATECIYTLSWRMRTPVPNFEQKWLKRIANNFVSRHKIRGIVKFMSENRELFRPPEPSTFQ
ncbi:hypothetical protein AVEN_6927-1 [Araneus ventricosus]|uniref:Uncharacterized protein n=1 Tax=Araneus ventricosus TaxID=182803 RepID=A0A4Y2KHC0_ARAVE|nr:hypothetical protein AVEN_191320-1 [Araneus ventricosus]GBN02064.1 hypothetical protein AVEN_6927-1 [Araneus ventricosus]